MYGELPSQRALGWNCWHWGGWTRPFLWRAHCVWIRPDCGCCCKVSKHSNCEWWVILWLIVVLISQWMLSRHNFSPLTKFSFSTPDQGIEEAAIGVFWVTDGIDRCLVGFLPRHCIRHRKRYEGRVAKIVEFLKMLESSYARQRSKKTVVFARQLSFGM